MNLERQKEFLKELRQASNSYGEADIFRDACRIFALTLHQQTIIDKTEYERYEQEYMSYVEKYGKVGMEHIANCMGIVVTALEERREDFLGHILEVLNLTTKSFGQFFTPEPVSRMMAAVTMGNDKPIPGKFVRMNDPACGAGVLLIEGEEAFLQRGGRQGDLIIYAEDLDYNACNIAYTQFSLLGYAARVTRMDSLCCKVYEGPWWTIGYFAHAIPMRTNCERIFERKEEPDEKKESAPSGETDEKPEPPSVDVNVRKVVQGELF